MDFTNLPRRNKTYTGANGSKISVDLNGEVYTGYVFTASEKQGTQQQGKISRTANYADGIKVLSAFLLSEML